MADRPPSWSDVATAANLAWEQTREDAVARAADMLRAGVIMAEHRIKQHGAAAVGGFVERLQRRKA